MEMEKELSMTKQSDLLQSATKLLYGDAFGWQTRLADELGCSKRSVVILHGTGHLPKARRIQILSLLSQRGIDISQFITEELLK